MFRRQLTPSLLAGAALFLGGCVFGGGGDDSEATPTATPVATSTVAPTSEATRTPTVAATATAEPLPDLPPGLEVSPAGTWESRELSDGDEVPDVLGAFVFDADAGVGTLWSLSDEAIEDAQFAFISTSRSGRYVVATARPYQLVDTETGNALRWDDRVRLSLADDRGLAVFSANDRPCEIWAVDLNEGAPEGLGSFDLTSNGVCGHPSARLSPDGEELLVLVNGDGFQGGAGLVLIHLPTGAFDTVASFPVPSVAMSEDGPQRAALFHWFEDGVLEIAAYRWSDRNLVGVSIETGIASTDPDRGPPAPGRVTISPDGRLVAWSEQAALGLGLGAGGEAEWPVTVIAEIEQGAPTVRAQRVTLSNGIRSFEWLADSSAIVVQSEAGFALLGVDGTLEALPFPLAFHTDPIPVPAPDRATRFAYDGAVVDRTGASAGAAPVVAEPWGAGSADHPRSWWTRTSYAWGLDSTRLILVRTEVPGRDYGRGGIAGLGLPARIVTGDAAALGGGAIELVIASDGDRLNVRAAPGLNESRIGQLDHGSAVTVERDASITDCGDAGCSILRDPDLEYGAGWWIYVSDGAGLEGWVSTEFVAWAE